MPPRCHASRSRSQTPFDREAANHTVPSENRQVTVRTREEGSVHGSGINSARSEVSSSRSEISASSNHSVPQQQQQIPGSTENRHSSLRELYYRKKLQDGGDGVLSVRAHVYLPIYAGLQPKFLAVVEGCSVW